MDPVSRTPGSGKSEYPRLGSKQPLNPKRKVPADSVTSWAFYPHEAYIL